MRFLNYSHNSRVLPTYYHSFSPGDRAELFITRVQNLYDRPVTSLHHHPTFELGFCESGSGKVYIDDRIYDFGPGSVSFIRANQPHYSASDPGTSSVWYWIYFSPQKLFSNAGMTIEPGSLRENCFGGVFGNELPGLMSASESFAKAAKAAADHDDFFTRFDLALAAGKLLLEAFRVGGENATVFRTAAAVRFISNNYNDPGLMREEVIARESGISPSYLRSLFVRETGMPPRDFISKTRLAAATNLLTETNLKIIEISEKCGFESLPGFNRRFGKVYGITPGEYRKTYGHAENPRRTGSGQNP